MRRRSALPTLLLAALPLCVSCSSSPQGQTKVQRQPLEKEHREYETPTNYKPRDVGYDPKTGKTISYDHKPRVELLDQKSGKYAFKWIGYDGKEKSVVFQRGDVIDVIVSGSAVRANAGQYLYTYEVQNLSSSGSYLTTFTVQNYSEDVRPDKKGPMLVLTMSKAIYKFREGHWISFNDASDDLQINPGQSVKLQITSSAPPGLVGCAVVGGQLTIEGAGEDMPSALENLLPGYEEWPHGYTIGPVDRLKSLSSQERIKYLLENLPVFHNSGWMTDEAFARYQEHLKNGDLNRIRGQIDQDLKTEQITTEVFAMISEMK